ncbi:MAG TPA: putative O-glycosylation ligase, exosortase A system-associated [Telluria sp.]
MRDALVFLAVFGSLPFIFKRPAVGAMVYAWLSLMNPHRLTYGAAYDFPFAMIVAAATLFSMLISKERKDLPANSFVFMLFVFAAWMTLTSFFALEPDLVWPEWERVMKTFGMVLITMSVVRSERDIKELVWVIAMSLGFFGLKGGIFTVASGGSSHVFGPDDSYISDNNALALALVTVLPMIWYLQQQSKQRYLRIGLTGLVAATLIAAAGSYSRGALVAGGAMLTFLWLKSRSKVRTGIVLLMIAPLVYLVMPHQWFARMDTIDNYQADDSALGRINAWGFALNIAKSHLMGGGYKVFTPRLFFLYAPEPTNHHAAHSIYFQVIGEHGFIGVTLFLILMVCAWRNGSRILALCKNRPEWRWASDLAAMGQVSMIGFAVGGAFLTLAYYDLIYYIVATLAVTERLLKERLALERKAVAGSVRTAPLGPAIPKEIT